MAKAEKFLVENQSLKELFNKDFLEKLNKLDKNIFPATVFFVKEFERNGKKMVTPLILSHQNNKEVQNNILHIESPDTKLLDNFIKMIENKVKK